MTATTATIYARALKPGDVVAGFTVGHATGRDTIEVTWTDRTVGTYRATDPVDVAADTDRDAATIWVPPVGYWPGPCVCPLRRNPVLEGTWDKVPGPRPCEACTRKPYDDED